MLGPVVVDTTYTFASLWTHTGPTLLYFTETFARLPWLTCRGRFSAAMKMNWLKVNTVTAALVERFYLHLAIVIFHLVLPAGVAPACGLVTLSPA